MPMRTLAERIADFQTQRAAAVTEMSTLVDQCETEQRVFTDDESAKFDDINARVKGFDDQLERLDAMQNVQKKTVVPANDGGVYATNGGVQIPDGARITVRSNLPKGTGFTRLAMAILATKGALGDAERMAQARWKDTPEVAQILQYALATPGGTAGLSSVYRAVIAPGNTTDATWASPLVLYQTLASEFIELLRPETIIGQIPGFRRVPFNVRVARQTGGAVAGWVGEGLSKPVSKLAFDAVQIPWAKMAVIVLLTEELIRFSTPSAEALVSNDMRAAISAFMNSQFIDPTITGTPNLSPESVTHAGVQVPSTGITLAAIMTDVQKLLTNMAGAGITGPFVWVMHPRTAISLSMIRTSQDVYAFPEMAGGKTFRGYPVVVSAAVPVDGLSKTIMVLMAPDEIFLADDGDISLDMSREASVQADSAPATPPTPVVSLWQQNMVGIKAERYAYWLLRNPAGVQVLTGVAY